MKHDMGSLWKPTFNFVRFRFKIKIPTCQYSSYWYNVTGNFNVPIVDIFCSLWNFKIITRWFLICWCRYRGDVGELDPFSSVASTDAIFKCKIIKHFIDNKDPVLFTYYWNFKNLDPNVSPELMNKRTSTNGASWHTPGWVGKSILEHSKNIVLL